MQTIAVEIDLETGDPGSCAEQFSADLYQGLCRILRPETPTAALTLRASCKRLLAVMQNTGPGYHRRLAAAVGRFAAAVGAAGPVQEDPLFEGCFFVIPLRGDYAVWIDRADRHEGRSVMGIGNCVDVTTTAARWAADIREARRCSGDARIAALEAAAARGLLR